MVALRRTHSSVHPAVGGLHEDDPLGGSQRRVSLLRSLRCSFSDSRPHLTRNAFDDAVGPYRDSTVVFARLVT